MNSFEKKISFFKLALVHQMPFYGEILLRVPIVKDYHIRTACTTGRVIYYNPMFFMSLSEPEWRYVLMHELLHIILMHPYRVKDRDAEIWNVAADLIVNYTLDLINQSLKDPINISRPQNALTGYTSYGTTTETLYNDLYKLNKEKGKQGFVLIHSKGINSYEYVRARSDIIPSNNTAVSNDSVKGLPRGELNELMKKLIAKDRSSFGHETLRFELNGILQGKKIKWSNLLREFLIEETSDETSYLTPERKYIHMDLIVPGYSLSAERIEEIWAFVDSSGSISYDEMKEFLFQLYSICREFKCIMNICYWDTEVEDVYRKIHNKEDITKCLPNHSGGTDINCVYKWLRENKVKPDLMLILTDGYFGALNNEIFMPNLKKKTVLVLSNNDILTDDMKRIGKITRLV